MLGVEGFVVRGVEEEGGCLVFWGMVSVMRFMRKWVGD